MYNVELIISICTCHIIFKSLYLLFLGCVLCDNEPLFKHGEPVAVPPLPPVAIIKKCEKLNHHKCFAQSLEADQRFAHSVEELVVWMVESENECSFEQFAATAGLLQARRVSSDASKCEFCETSLTVQNDMHIKRCVCGSVLSMEIDCCNGWWELEVER